MNESFDNARDYLDKISFGLSTSGMNRLNSTWTALTDEQKRNSIETLRIIAFYPTIPDSTTYRSFCDFFDKMISDFSQKISLTTIPLLTKPPRWRITVNTIAMLNVVFRLDSLGIIIILFLTRMRFSDICFLPHELGHRVLMIERDMTSRNPQIETKLRNQLLELSSDIENLNETVTVAYNWLRELAADHFALNAIGPVYVEAISSICGQLTYDEEHPPLAIRRLCLAPEDCNITDIIVKIENVHVVISHKIIDMLNNLAIEFSAGIIDPPAQESVKKIRTELLKEQASPNPTRETLAALLQIELPFPRFWNSRKTKSIMKRIIE